MTQTTTKLHCLRCGHTWPTRLTQTKPRSCPACRSYRWDTPKPVR